MAKKENTSPMLQQYLDIKKLYGRYILFFRLGDFYEMFFEDAVVVSRELELALTSRAGAPMCGVPFHSCEGYLKKLIERGYKVAICEQLSDPSASKGLVQRDVIRLISAGTVIEAGMLNEDRNNYITSIYSEETKVALVFSDISTGDAHVFELSEPDLERKVISEISRFDPVELLVDKNFYKFHEIDLFFRTTLKCCTCDTLSDEYYDSSDESVITSQLEEGKIDDLSEMPLAKKALCALFRYVGNAQRTDAKRFVNIIIHTTGESMGLNLTTRRNLELTETMRTKEKRGSLLWVLDKTITGMGRRRLRTWVEQPLISPMDIIRRLDAVEELVNDNTALFEICDALKGIYDLERLMTRVVYKTASPRDIYVLGQTCARIPDLKDVLMDMRSQMLWKLNTQIDALGDIAGLVEKAIVDDPPMNLKDGGVVRSGFSNEIDKLREIMDGGQNVLKELEERERAATGIRTLKVGFNRVFGYYIEVSKSYVDKVPAHYHRKQTLTTGERYITDELKEIEEEILGASDKLQTLEQMAFNEVCNYIASKLEITQTTARAIAETDALCSFAQVSLENGYVKPEITLENVIDIRAGRHPVVEKMLPDTPFTPNDVLLDAKKNKLIVITGPNMSGKSTYMRQNALIVIMAQIGCFVPARYAKIGIVDKIFTRVGASDDLTAGQSTFMVEMNEVADIIKNATRDSLVILDEIGRGTSTFDGISIARAVAEYICSKNLGCKTLFATHYHELLSLEESCEGARNFSIAVSRHGEDIKFLHKIVEGGTDDSYGIEVARLAGLPPKVLARAREELIALENSVRDQREFEYTMAARRAKQEQFSITSINEKDVISRLKSCDTDSITPFDALVFIKALKDML